MTAVKLKTIEELTASHTAWYSSNDQDIWSGGPYDTREEAEAEAAGSEHRLIVQATKPPIRLSRYFTHGEFLEGVDDALCDYHDPDGCPATDFAPAVNMDLQARVCAAIDEWQVAHQLAPCTWAFTGFGAVETAAWVKDAEEAIAQSEMERPAVGS
ncbi:hypothetical protein [uncultured Paracoccus sp.]|uniref:hypothetical protein n=1 Tax=uncultured Paracoccus sp. TaxID=189685 RepID=UPI0025E2F73A|nr:hypothetical protein [uncultured Paracoccus sp.]